MKAFLDALSLGTKNSGSGLYKPHLKVTCEYYDRGDVTTVPLHSFTVLNRYSREKSICHQEKKITQGIIRIVAWKGKKKRGVVLPGKTRVRSEKYIKEGSSGEDDLCMNG